MLRCREMMSNSGPVLASLWLLLAVLDPRGTAVLAAQDVKGGEASRRPSILLVMPDQMRGQDMGCMGNPEVRTPTWTGWPRRASCSATPSPTRPSAARPGPIILTGKYAHRNGMVANDLRLRESETTLAEILGRTAATAPASSASGTSMAASDCPASSRPGRRRQGFAFWAANECNHAHFRPVYFRDTDRPIIEDRFEPEVWTDRAIEFLQQAGDRPFFLMVAMGPPHDPYGAPEKYMKLYDPARLTMRPNWVEGVPGAGRKEIAAYYAAITADRRPGRPADDGAGGARAGRGHDRRVHLGPRRHARLARAAAEAQAVGGVDPGAGHRAFPRQGCSRAAPSEALLTHVDLAPTLLALCGVPVPAEMQGTDLSRRRARADGAGPDSAFFQIFVPFAGDGTPQPWRGVRTEPIPVRPDGGRTLAALRPEGRPLRAEKPGRRPGLTPSVRRRWRRSSPPG